MYVFGWVATLVVIVILLTFLGGFVLITLWTAGHFPALLIIVTLAIIGLIIVKKST